MDRALRLVGYEIFRFGASELLEPNAEEVLIGFYRSLFERYSLHGAMTQGFPRTSAGAIRRLSGLLARHRHRSSWEGGKPKK
ncbi:hypothetical protein FHK92_03000 [Pseudomonas brassicacearum subsp. neoaurantiaca]|uniref:Uncharacterized protein n=1 Tax=Pseudomonas brassicacearum subsp. neoaurantiaca TaxID=494916 RepID=A0A7V8UBD1_9PSED|nr:hypothetical protein [Pseudomonas brassicacearum subsp. neoaurantiaca]